MTGEKRVLDMRFRKERKPEAILATMKKERPDRKVIGLPFYDPNKGNVSGWYVENECRDCGKIAIHKVYNLVKRKSGCARCRGRRSAERTRVIVAERMAKAGRVSFNREMSPEHVLELVEECRSTDREFLGLPEFIPYPHETKGEWEIKNKCRWCGYIDTNKTSHLCNKNTACKGCGRRPPVKAPGT